MKLEGKITTILANFYYVQDLSNKVWECFARGRILKEGKQLFVGDAVEIETSNDLQGVITSLGARKNKLSKPSVANIDQVLVTFSTCEPDFDFYNIDRYLSFIRYELPYEEIIICMNKIDLKKINIDETYKDSKYEIYYVSALTKEGLEILASKLINKATVLTGPSGVGKSSLIKALAPEEDILTGSLSAIKQGKHITRNVRLIPINYKNDIGFLVDTPGFTQFSFASLNPHKILHTFDELNNTGCSFTNCLHNGEEGCKLTNNDLIPKSRHESYLRILNEAKEEIIYDTKDESKTKSVGGNKKSKSKLIPKIDELLRIKSRKKEKQELRRLDEENS